MPRISPALYGSSLAVESCQRRGHLQTVKQGNPSQSEKAVENGVILAGGKGERFRHEGINIPKVLLEVGGRRLLERAILNLRDVGIDHIYVIVGAYREQVVEVISSLKSLSGIDIKFLLCRDYEEGNGVSLSNVAAVIKDEAFVLTMGDHIISKSTLKIFLEDAERNARLPSLACDPNLKDIFDMDDATKVLCHGGRIVKIGKSIEQYNLIDMGLFYFPQGYAWKIESMVRHGAKFISDIVSGFISDQGFRTAVLPLGQWQDVDNPDMRNEAERRLKLWDSW